MKFKVGDFVVGTKRAREMYNYGIMTDEMTKGRITDVNPNYCMINIIEHKCRKNEGKSYAMRINHIESGCLDLYNEKKIEKNKKSEKIEQVLQTLLTPAQLKGYYLGKTIEITYGEKGKKMDKFLDYWKKYEGVEVK